MQAGAATGSAGRAKDGGKNSRPPSGRNQEAFTKQMVQATLRGHQDSSVSTRNNEAGTSAATPGESIESRAGRHVLGWLGGGRHARTRAGRAGHKRPASEVPGARRRLRAAPRSRHAPPQRGMHHRHAVHALAGAGGHRQVGLLHQLKVGTQGGGQAVSRPAGQAAAGGVGRVAGWGRGGQPGPARGPRQQQCSASARRKRLRCGQHGIAEAPSQGALELACTKAPTQRHRAPPRSGPSPAAAPGPPLVRT